MKILTYLEKIETSYRILQILQFILRKKYDEEGGKMKRRKGKIAVAILSMCFLLGFLTLPASASTTEYLWNEDTEEVIKKVESPVVDETLDAEDESTDNESTEAILAFSGTLRN